MVTAAETNFPPTRIWHASLQHLCQVVQLITQSYSLLSSSK